MAAAAGAAAGRPARVPARARAPRRRTSSALPDPANPLRAPGPFGDEVGDRVPGVRAARRGSPTRSPRPGELREIELPSRLLRTSVDASLWSAAETDPDAAAAAAARPRRAGVRASTRRSLRLLDHLVAFGEVPPFRAALLPPPLDRNETYSASRALRARARRRSGCRRSAAAPSPGAPVGLGREPRRARAPARALDATRGSSAACFLQSGSFFRRRFDSHESGFAPLRPHHALRLARRAAAGATPSAIPVTHHVRHRRGEPRQQPRHRRGARGAGLARARSSSTATRTTGSRGATRSTRTSPSCSCGRPHEARGPRRRSSSYGHWGRPLLVFPAAAGATGTSGRTRGMIDALAGLIEEGRVKVYCVDSWDSGTLARRRLPLEERARRHGAYEDWLLGARRRRGSTPTAAAPGDRRHRRLDRRLPRGEPRAAPRRPLPARALPVRRLRRRRASAGASAATPSTSTTRSTTSPHLARRPPRLAALARAASARRRAGRVGGLDRRARVDAAVRRRCSPRRGSRTSSTSGATTSPHDWPAWRAQIAHHLPRLV